MTLLFGMGMGPVGVLCADTRTNLQAGDWTWKRNDTGVRRFALRDGSVLDVPDVKRKLRRVACGWLAASSSSYLLSEAIFESLSDGAMSEPSEVYRTSANVLRQQGEGLRAEFSDPDPHDQVNLIYLYGEGRAFRVGHCKVGRDDEPGQVSDYVLSLPDDFDDALLHDLSQKLKRALFVPTDAAGLWELARAIADLVYCVHGASESVSDHMDLVVLVRDAASEVMLLEWHGRSSELREAEDSMISAMMTVSNEAAEKHGT